MKAWWTAALLAAAASGAQAAEPVTVEVIGNGAVEVRAIAQRVTVTWAGRAATKVAAEADQARKEAAVLRALTEAGVPAGAITAVSPAEQTRQQLAGLATSDDAATEPAAEEVSGGRTVELASLAQLAALTPKLEAIGAKVGTPTPVYGDIAPARRNARLAALEDARAGAARYAVALRLRVGGIRRVSEAGNNWVLPGLQEKLATAIATGGSGLMQTMMQPPKETAKVEEAVVAEFTLLP